MGWKDDPVIKEPSWKSDPVLKAPTRPPEDVEVEEVVVKGKARPKWSDLPGNIPKSAAQFGRNLIEPLLHPIQTARGIGELAGGALQHVRDLSPREFQGPAPKIDTRTADAAKQALIERYGSPSALKNTMIEDPVGFASDVSLVLGGTGSALARVGGTAGKVGRVAETAAKVIDPVAATGRVIKGVPSVVGKAVAPALGFTSTTSPRIVRTAYDTGVKGGSAGQAFRGQMRDTAPIENLIEEARIGVDKIRADRQAKYLADMADAKGQGAASATPIDFAPIQQVVDDVKNRGQFKGKRIDPSADSAWGKIDALVEDWAQSNPVDYHNVEGVDALKKGISNIEQGLEIGSPGRNAAKAVRVAITNEIAKQAPKYAEAMKGYETASALLEDLDKSLSVGKKAAINTTLRKLMSVLKEDSSSGFGRNAKLGQLLEDNGAHDLNAMLAGRAMNPALPLGLRGTMSGLGALTYAGSVGSPWLGLPAIAASSPRLVGEVAHAAGVASRPVKAVSGAIEGAYNAVRPAPLALTQSQNYLPEPTQSDDLSAMLAKYLGQPPKMESAKEPAAEEPAAEASTNTDYDVDYLASLIAGHEGEGKNPESSAVGPFQFVSGTLAETYNQMHPKEAPITPEQADAMRADGRITDDDLREMGKFHTQKNVDFLIENDLPITAANVYLMHFAGRGAAPKVIAAEPTAPITDILSPAQIEANANIRYNGKNLADFTAQDLRDWANDVMVESADSLEQAANN